MLLYNFFCISASIFVREIFKSRVGLKWVCPGTLVDILADIKFSTINTPNIFAPNVGEYVLVLEAIEADGMTVAFSQLVQS
jgi:hypothetical protein